MCLKYCACHEKVRPGHTKCCACHRKSSYQTWRSDAQNATPLRKSAPGHPNISDEHVSCIAPATRNAFLQIFIKCQRFWNCYKTLTFCSLLARWTTPCACHAKRHLSVQKCSEPFSFCTFDLEICFAPQRRALLRHVNFQKRSDTEVLCTFWLGNVLRATPAFFDMATAESAPTLVRFVHFDLETRSAPQCAFSTFQFPKVLRSWRALYVCTFWLQNVLRATTACNISSLIWPDGSAPAALASLLFDLPELPNWKNMVTWGLEALTKSTFSAAAYH